LKVKFKQDYTLLRLRFTLYLLVGDFELLVGFEEHDLSQSFVGVDFRGQRSGVADFEVTNPSHSGSKGVTLTDHAVLASRTGDPLAVSPTTVLLLGIKIESGRLSSAREIRGIANGIRREKPDCWSSRQEPSGAPAFAKQPVAQCITRRELDNVQTPV